MAGAPHDAVVGAAEKLLRVQRGTLRRSAALLREARDYDPSRFVDGGGNRNGEEDGGPAARGATAAAAGGGGVGSATDFAAKLARRRRSSSRRSGGGESGGESSGGESENGDGSDGAAADALAVELDPRARDALAELRQQEDRLDELRGYAPGERHRRALGGDGDDDEVMEVRGGDGGGRPGPLAMVDAGDGGAAAAGGVGGHHHQNTNALLGGARNARCPLTSKPLAEIADPVEDARGFVYERAAVERYILTETAKRFFGGGGRGTRAMPVLPPPGSSASAYPADVVQRATDAGVVAPVAGTGHNVSLGALRPARRLLRELAARRARAAGGADEMEGGGAGAGADIEISE